MRLRTAAAVVFTLAAPLPAHAQDVKLSTWNLNWLTLRPAGDPALPDDVHPRREGDFARLRAYADRLNADVVAFQEVDGAAAAARVFDPARYRIVTIGETVVQQVGLAVRRGMTVHVNDEVSGLDVEPAGAAHRLRDGLDATLGFAGGATLRVLVVHLKSGCQRDVLALSRKPACRLLAAQVPVLAAWARARAEEGGAFALIGDFNREMDQEAGDQMAGDRKAGDGPAGHRTIEDGTDADRQDSMQAALEAAAPLLRVTAGHANPCWDGASFIDHIFLGGAGRAWLVPGSLRVLRYDERGEADKARLSDHCPVSVRVAPIRPG